MCPSPQEKSLFIPTPTPLCLLTPASLTPFSLLVVVTTLLYVSMCYMFLVNPFTVFHPAPDPRKLAL